MRYRISLTLIIVVAVVAALCFASYCFAAGQSSSAKTESNDPNFIPFPYIAETTEDNVNIRSGPGTNFYSCGKLNGTDKVEVVATQLSWSQIVPPPSCFAWISKQYVTTDTNVPNSGTVNADAVRVYAGSESLKPIHSTTVLVKLNKGDKVALSGQQEGDYLKIAPPPGSYLWISTNYTKPIGPASAVERPTPAPMPTPALVPTNLSVEAQKLAEYYALEKQFRAEKEKPLEQQNYQALKKALIEIAGNKEAGKAARYSEYAIKQIEQCELAQRVGTEVGLQDSQFDKTMQKIEKARDAKLAEVQDLSKFVAVGQLQVSSIYGSEEQTKRYRLIDESTGKTICYAQPTGSAVNIDMTKFIGQQVGLIGTIETAPQVSSVLVRFTGVEEIK
jgi:uncharacterized protein YgiM (DUF1202 family)